MKLSPKWIPGKIGGKPVTSVFNIPVTFNSNVDNGSGSESTGNSKNSSVTENAGASKTATDNVESENQVYLSVEKLAEYPGGQFALMKFVSENVKTPADLTGKKNVIVRFVIEKDGSLTDAKIIRSGGEECDKEALALIKKMPKWTPGEVKGKPVRSVFNLPVIFKEK